MTDNLGFFTRLKEKFDAYPPSPIPIDAPSSVVTVEDIGADGDTFSITVDGLEITNAATTLISTKAGIANQLAGNIAAGYTAQITGGGGLIIFQNPTGSDENRVIEAVVTGGALLTVEPFEIDK
jgi:hypothetical protein